MNKPVPPEPVARTYELLTHLPELTVKFGTFANPPPGYGYASVAPGAVTARPVVSVAEGLRAQAIEAMAAVRAAAAAGGAGVLAALTGLGAGGIERGDVMADVPGAYLHTGYGRAASVEEQYDEDGALIRGAGYIPNVGPQVQRNGQQVE